MNIAFVSEKGNIIAANLPLPSELINYGGRKHPDSYNWAISEGRILRYEFGEKVNAHWFDAKGNHLRPATAEEWVFAHSWGQEAKKYYLELPLPEFIDHGQNPNVKFLGNWYHAYAIPSSGIRYQLGKLEESSYYTGDYGTAFVEINDDADSEPITQAIDSQNGLVDMG